MFKVERELSIFIDVKPRELSPQQLFPMNYLQLFILVRFKGFPTTMES